MDKLHHLWSIDKLQDMFQVTTIYFPKCKLKLAITSLPTHRNCCHFLPHAFFQFTHCSRLVSIHCVCKTPQKEIWWVQIRAMDFPLNIKFKTDCVSSKVILRQSLKVWCKNNFNPFQKSCSICKWWSYVTVTFCPCSLKENHR